MSQSLESLEPRQLLALTTYTLVELPLNIADLNNADQLLAPNTLYQIRKGGRLTATPLPRLDPDANLGARQINDDGIIIGTEGTIGPSDDVTSRPVVMGPNGAGVYDSRYLNTADDPDADDQPNAPVLINNAGQILTQGDDLAGVGTELLIQLGARGRTTSVALNSLRPDGETLAIDDPSDLNNLGQMVGTNTSGAVDNYATLRRGRLYLTPASTLSADAFSDVQRLTALNDVGQIVGNTAAGFSTDPTATLYQLSSRGRYYRTFLSPLPGKDVSVAIDINNFGQVLGHTYTNPVSGPILDQTAFIVQRGSNGKYGAPVDLNTLIPDPGTVRVTRPIALNETGLILAEGASTRNGSQRFVLLIPSRSNPLPTTTTAVTTPVQDTLPSTAKPTPTAAPRATPFASADFIRSDDNLW